MNKLVFRIIGALASSLIIISVFVPFISAYGYFQSLWEANETVGMIYIPIAIIIFGAIGVLGFAINIKTEFVYTSFGAMLFYLIMETVPILKQGAFNTLGMGYYLLLIGTVLIGIMTFLCKLNPQKKVKETQKENITPQMSVLNQINRLYDGDSSNAININSYSAPVNSLSVEQNQSNNQFGMQPSVNPMDSMPEVQQPLVNPMDPIPEVQQPPANPMDPIPEVQQLAVNPVISQLDNTNFINNNLEKSTSQDSTGILFDQNIVESNISQNNPVVSEFSDSIPQTFINVNPVNGDSEIKKDEVHSNNNLDIFN